MSEIASLHPSALWRWFEAITRIPRPSGHEERIVGWLEETARAEGLDYRKDAAGNIVLRKPASPDRESSPVVVLQSHVDMVAEKNAAVAFDFLRDPIQAYVDGDWVRARGTTLGADDGIGMAAALAVLTDPALSHGPIEALFTVDEESGLTGAFGLGEGMISGRYLVNLDSEDEGEIFIGCAGGIDTVGELRYEKEPADEDSVAFSLTVHGLVGGHSGDDIEKGRANANRVLARFLLEASGRRDLRLARFDGGNLRNAIPREATAEVTVPAGEVDVFKEDFEHFAEQVRAEYRVTEPGMALALTAAAAAEVMDRDAQRRLLPALTGLPNGVLAMSAAIPGLVETSSNLASVKFTGDDRVVITTSQRSAVESARAAAAASAGSVLALAGATVVHSAGYPGWAPDRASPLLAVAEEVYLRRFGTPARVRAIHAGLECGLFLQRAPGLQMISIGPTVRGAHSPDERLEVASVAKFRELLIGILEQLRD